MEASLPPLKTYDPALAKIATLSEVFSCLSALKVRYYLSTDDNGTERSFEIKTYTIMEGRACYRVLWYGDNPMATGPVINLPALATEDFKCYEI
jgi:hypothetical protein